MPAGSIPTMMVGRELEQLNVAWFEEPLWCDDIPGHARLADDLDIPIAMGNDMAPAILIFCNAV